MKPSIGRIIVVKGVRNTNGTDEHPAIVNRVWSNQEPAEGTVLVNATMFPDCTAAPQSVSSIRMLESRADAEAFLAAGTETRVAFWPERV